VSEEAWAETQQRFSGKLTPAQFSWLRNWFQKNVEGSA